MSESSAKPLTKSEVIARLAEKTQLSKQQVSQVFDEIVNLVGESLSESGPGVLNLAGLFKVRVIRKPAQPEREGINPFTKEKTIFKAKPATNVVKISALKRLKDVV